MHLKYILMNYVKYGSKYFLNRKPTYHYNNTIITNIYWTAQLVLGTFQFNLTFLGLIWGFNKKKKGGWQVKHQMVILFHLIHTDINW